MMRKIRKRQQKKRVYSMERSHEITFMELEYSSLLMTDSWDLVPPPEEKNIVGSAGS